MLDEGAHYLMPVKANRASLLADLEAFDWNAMPTCEILDKGHGRLERRVCAAVVLEGVDQECAALPGRCQAFRIVRERTTLDTARRRSETVFGLTSLSPEQASPADILALNCGYREIENRLHSVRDFSFDEDRSCARAGHLTRHLACLSNPAISIVRLRGRFRYQPQAQRHCAARHAQALREVLDPPR